MSFFFICIYFFKVEDISKMIGHVNVKKKEKTNKQNWVRDYRKLRRKD